MYEAFTLSWQSQRSGWITKRRGSSVAWEPESFPTRIVIIVPFTGGHGDFSLCLVSILTDKSRGIYNKIMSFNSLAEKLNI